MCAVKAACLFTDSQSSRATERGRFRLSVLRVRSKPRSLKLRETSGSIPSARKNSACAGRPSALNLRKLSSIGRQNLQQAVFDEVPDEFGQDRKSTRLNSSHGR